MREILYKAKGRDNGKWVEGYYVLFRKCHYILPIFNNDVFYRYEKWPFYGCEEWIEVDPSTVCQYTGLTDKNGLKIWEGDIIVAGNYKWKCKVVWDEKCARFIGLTNDKDVKLVYIGMADKNNNSAVEVIGNIYENPELLNTN